MRIALVVMSAAVLAGCATEAQIQQQNNSQVAALTRESMRSCVTIKDDRLETLVTFSTEPCLQRRNGLLKIVWDDELLRAFKSKKDGSVTYQVYTHTYSRDWLFPQSANFGVGDVQSAPVDRVSSDVDCSLLSSQGYCDHIEDYAFDLSAGEIEKISAKAAADPSYTIWTYRVKTQSGVDVNRSFAVAEILGLADVVSAYALK